MGTVLFAQSAQTDLLEAWVFIAEENLGAADRVLDTIEQEAKTLATQPLICQTRPQPTARPLRPGSKATKRPEVVSRWAKQ